MHITHNDTQSKKQKSTQSYTNSERHKQTTKDMEPQTNIYRRIHVSYVASLTMKDTESNVRVYICLTVIPVCED
jgi:hypothetical protein